MVVACSYYLLKLMTWPNKTRKNPTQRIPYAYKPSEDDPLVLVPDEEIVAKVEEAMDYLDEGYSGRKVTDWLNDKVERQLSHQGLRNIWKLHRPKSKRVKQLKRENNKTKPKTKEEKEEILQRRRDNPHLINNSDYAIGDILRRMGRSFWYVDPSPVSHISEHSTINHGGNKGRRNCWRCSDWAKSLEEQAPINFSPCEISI